jgi:hypothetical protein
MMRISSRYGGIHFSASGEWGAPGTTIFSATNAGIQPRPAAIRPCPWPTAHGQTNCGPPIIHADVVQHSRRSILPVGAVASQRRAMGTSAINHRVDACLMGNRLHSVCAAKLHRDAPWVFSINQQTTKDAASGV